MPNAPVPAAVTGLPAVAPPTPPEMFSVPPVIALPHRYQDEAMRVVRVAIDAMNRGSTARCEKLRQYWSDIADCASRQLAHTRASTPLGAAALTAFALTELDSMESTDDPLRSVIRNALSNALEQLGRSA